VSDLPRIFYSRLVYESRFVAVTIGLVVVPLTAAAEPHPVASFDPHAVAAPEDPRWDAARTSIERGEALVRVGNYEAALVDFLQAYELLAQHPRRYVVLHNIAMCHEHMFRYDDALRYFERYLDEGGLQAEDRTKVSESIDALRKLLATVHVTSNVEAELWIDGRASYRVPAILSITAGTHVLELKAPQYDSVRRSVQLHAREEYRYRFDLTRAQGSPDVSPVYFVSSAGIATASLVAGIVLAISTVTARDSALARANATMRLRTRELEERQSNIRGLALASDLAFGSAALFGTAALVFYFLCDWSSDVPPEARPVATLNRGKAHRSW